MHSGISEISAAFSFTSLSLHSVVEHTILSVFAVSLHNMILALSSYLSSGFGCTGAHDFGSVFVARQFAVLPNVHLVFLISLLGCPVTYVWFLYVFLFRCIPICLTSFLPLPFLKLPFLKLLRMDAKLSCLLTCLPTFPPPSRDSGFRVKDFLSADLHQFFVFILSSHGTVGAFCLGCFHKEFWSVSCLGGFCSKCSLFVSHFFVGV